MNLQKVVLGCGCFWGAQDLLRKQVGVVESSVGYAGGNTLSPTYRDVCTGETGHAEVVHLVFDQAQIDLKQILLFFFRIHDPTTLNKQGNDVGTQYRSIILCESDQDMDLAKEVIEEVQARGWWKKPIVTQVARLQNFFPAEDYHQDYLIKNPKGYSCHFVREFST